jgi:hypothetical protein
VVYRSFAALPSDRGLAFRFAGELWLRTSGRQEGESSFPWEGYASVRAEGNWLDEMPCFAWFYWGFLGGAGSGVSSKGGSSSRESGCFPLRGKHSLPPPRLPSLRQRAFSDLEALGVKSGEEVDRLRNGAIQSIAVFAGARVSSWKTTTEVASTPPACCLAPGFLRPDSPTGTKTTRTHGAASTVGVRTFSRHFGNANRKTPIGLGGAPNLGCSTVAVPCVLTASHQPQSSRGACGGIADAHRAAAPGAGETRLHRPGVDPGAPGNSEGRARAVASACRPSRGKPRLCAGDEREARAPRAHIDHPATRRARLHTLKPGREGPAGGGR